MPNHKLPKETKVLKGTFRPGREPENTPEFAEIKDIQPPEGMDGLALMTWEHFAPLLRDAKILRESDRVALEQYCWTYVRWKEANDHISIYGAVLQKGTSDDDGESAGGFMKNPACAVFKEASSELRALSAQLGLDPASRTRISVGKDEKPKKTFGQRRSAIS